MYELPSSNLAYSAALNDAQIETAVPLAIEQVFVKIYEMVNVQSYQLSRGADREVQFTLKKHSIELHSSTQTATTSDPYTSKGTMTSISFAPDFPTPQLASAPHTPAICPATHTAAPIAAPETHRIAALERF